MEQLEKGKGELRMSTVNLAEALILLEDRQPRLFEQLRTRLLTSGIRFVAPDAEQATTAAAARLRLPLNLGDCFAYALAVAQALLHLLWMLCSLRPPQQRKTIPMRAS